MIKVSRLGYAEFATRDVGRLEQYYTEIMGLSLTERAEGAAYLSVGLDHHNIVLAPSKEKRGLAAIGWQLDGQMALKEVQAELTKHGLACQIKHDAVPGIRELLEVTDPDGGTVHLYSEMELSAPGFAKQGIVPNKLGHIAIAAKNAQKLIAFYTELLGFAKTDWIGDVANFMTCNTDHHTLNVVAAPKSFMHHIAFELRDASHQYDSLDWLARHNIRTVWGPSRHTAGHNIAAYHFNPDNHFIELFTSMDIYIRELGYMEPRPWHEDLPMRPKVWDSLSYWGTDYAFRLESVGTDD